MRLRQWLIFDCHTAWKFRHRFSPLYGIGLTRPKRLDVSQTKFPTVLSLILIRIHNEPSQTSAGVKIRFLAQFHLPTISHLSVESSIITLKPIDFAAYVLHGHAYTSALIHSTRPVKAIKVGVYIRLRL